jgi:hypothetical protein
VGQVEEVVSRHLILVANHVAVMAVVVVGAYPVKWWLLLLVQASLQLLAQVALAAQPTPWELSAEILHLEVI